MAPVTDDGVEGGPATKGNLVKPSLTVPSYPEEEAQEEEEEEEADKAMVGHVPAGGKQAVGGPGGQPGGKSRGGSGSVEFWVTA